MLNFDGKYYEKIALHGGGCPMFGHYVGLFETLKLFEDFQCLNTPFITPSAGSMAILYFISNMKHKNKDVSFIFSKIFEECENVLNNMDQKSVVSFEFSSIPTVPSSTIMMLFIPIPACGTQML